LITIIHEQKCSAGGVATDCSHSRFKAADLMEVDWMAEFENYLINQQQGELTRADISSIIDPVLQLTSRAAMAAHKPLPTTYEDLKALKSTMK